MLNAIQLVCWPVSPAQEQLQELYRDGFRYLTKRRLLATVMTTGMDEDAWRDLCDHLTHRANGLLSMSLALVPVPAMTRHAKSLVPIGLKQMLLAGQPILCGIGGVLDHYTVVSGISANRLSFFRQFRGQMD